MRAAKEGYARVSDMALQLLDRKTRRQELFRGRPDLAALRPLATRDPAGPRRPQRRTFESFVGRRCA